MRKLFFILFTLFVTSTLIGQKAEPDGKWSVTLTGAFIPVPGGNFGIQPGVEYRFNERLSLLTEVTIRVGNKNVPDSQALNKKYFKIKPQLRYNFSKMKDGSKYYIGLQGSYSIRKFSIARYGFYYDKLPGDSVYFFDVAKVNSPVTTISIQFGTIISPEKKLSVDIFVGIGGRFINTEYTDIEKLRKGIRSRPADGPAFAASYSYFGHVTWLHLNAGLRFIYHFSQ